MLFVEREFRIRKFLFTEISPIRKLSEFESSEFLSLSYSGRIKNVKRDRIYYRSSSVNSLALPCTIKPSIMMSAVKMIT